MQKAGFSHDASLFVSLNLLRVARSRDFLSHFDFSSFHFDSKTFLDIIFSLHYISLIVYLNDP